MRNFKDYLEQKQREYGTKFDASDLDSRFVRSFETGGRIRVKFYGEFVKTGTVGITTGWKPVFLLMLTSRSVGSSHILNKSAEFTSESVTRGVC